MNRTAQNASPTLTIWMTPLASVAMAGGSSSDKEAGRKYRLACLRIASDRTQLLGDIQDPDLQPLCGRHSQQLSQHRAQSMMREDWSPLLRNSGIQKRNHNSPFQKMTQRL